MLKILALLLGLAANASAQYYSNSISTATGKATMKQAGSICVSASSATQNTCTVLLNGTGGVVTATTFVGSGSSLTFPSPTDFLKSTATILGVNTTNSTAWATVPGSTMSLNLTSAQYIKVEYSCNIKCVSNTRCGAAFAYMVDGAFTDGMSASTSSGFKYIETANTITDSPASLTILHRSTATKSAGTHTVSLLWASTGGVDIRMGSGVSGCSLVYKGEIDSLPISGMGGGGGGSGVSKIIAGSNVTISPVSGLGDVTVNAASAGAPGVTNNGAQSQASLQTLSCAVLPCQAQGTFGQYDIWVATGTGPGQWMNTRTGTGP